MSAEGFVPQTPQATPSAPIVDPMVAAQDAARSKAVAKVTQRAEVGNSQPDAAPSPATPRIDMDAATLKRLTAQSKALREAEAKVAVLQAGSKDVEGLAQAKKLYAEGKRLEAIALLSGNDASAEMEALMGAYLDAAPATPVDPNAAKLAELDAWKAEQTKQQEAEKAAREAEAIKQRDASIQGFAWSVLDAEKLPDGTAKFELCALPKNRGEAAVAALKLVSAVYAPKEYPDGNVTPDQAKALFAKAFADVEAEYEKDFAERAGSRFVARAAVRPPPRQAGQPTAVRPATTEPPPETRANQSPTLSRPAISTQAFPKSLTHQQALAKAIDRIKGFAR